MEQIKIFTTIVPHSIINPEKNSLEGQGFNGKITEWVKTEKIKNYRIVNAGITYLERGNYIVYAVFVAYTV